MRWILSALVLLSVFGSAATAALPIMLRQAWGAGAPILPMRSHAITHVTIHHLGETVPDVVDIPTWMRKFQAWCQQPAMLESGVQRAAWADIPYHYIVFRDGTIAQGRDSRYAGDTNTTYDPTGHLLITVAGNLEEQPLTDAQYASLVHICIDKCQEYRLSAYTIASHRDYAETDCPGKNVYARLEGLRAEVDAALHRHSLIETGVSP